MLDLDHVGAQHGQLIGRERPGQNVGDVDHPDAFERSHRDLLPWRPQPRWLRSSSSIETPSGARMKQTRTPGRTVVGSRVNSTPLALSSAAIASMPLTDSPKWSRPRYGVVGA